MDIRFYIEQEFPRILEEWKSLLRIPSVSSEREHKSDMVKCAERWRELLLSSGMQHAELIETEGNPIVYGEWKDESTVRALDCTDTKDITEKRKTVLIYGHYDVMPVEPLAEWKSSPFEPEIREGRLYARGADDDKGQSLIQVKAFEYMQKSGMLGCDVKIILEGEEEIGSPSLDAFLSAHREMLASDIIVVSDTSMLGKSTPSITTGLRGLAYWEIEVTGPNRDLHSGHFGGAVANPLNVLCKILSDVTDADGRIRIPGFYDDVLPIPAEERQMIAQVPFDIDEYKHRIGVGALSGERGYSTLERNSCRPSFDICGMWGGYTGEGSKTVIPSKAYAKVSCRLVPNQEHEKISKAFIKYIESVTPPTVSVKVTAMHGGEGYVCPLDLPEYKAAERGFEKAFGVKPLGLRRGGSIPIIASFERILGVKTILMGFGLEENAIHSPNESMDIDVFKKGIEAVAEFYANIQTKTEC